MFKYYSSATLVKMLECDQFDFEIKQIIRNQERYRKFPKTALRSAIIGESLTAASYPLDIYFGVICLASLSVAVTLALITSLGVLALALGVGIAWKTYRKAKKEDGKSLKKYELLMAKELVYQELIQRRQKKIDSKTSLLLAKISAQASKRNKITALKSILLSWGTSLNTLLSSAKERRELLTNSHFVKEIASLLDEKPRRDMGYVYRAVTYADKNTDPINYKAKRVQGVFSALVITSVLFGSFFVCSSYVLTGIGLLSLAATVSSPVGILTALGVASLIGVYYGYSIYKNSVLTAQKKRQISLMENEVARLENQYQDLEQKHTRLQKTTDIIKSLKNNDGYERNYLAAKDKVTPPHFHACIPPRMGLRCSL